MEPLQAPRNWGGWTSFSGLGAWGLRLKESPGVRSVAVRIDGWNAGGLPAAVVFSVHSTPYSRGNVVGNDDTGSEREPHATPSYTAGVGCCIVVL